MTDEHQPDEPAATTPATVQGGLLGGAATASGIALTATSGWLIVRASEQPVILTLLTAIVAVRAFGIARPSSATSSASSPTTPLSTTSPAPTAVYAALVPLTPARLGRRSCSSVLAGVVDDLTDVVEAQVRVTVPVPRVRSPGSSQRCSWRGSPQPAPRRRGLLRVGVVVGVPVPRRAARRPGGGPEGQRPSRDRPASSRPSAPRRRRPLAARRPRDVAPGRASTEPGPGPRGGAAAPGDRSGHRGRGVLVDPAATGAPWRPCSSSCPWRLATLSRPSSTPCALARAQGSGARLDTLSTRSRPSPTRRHPGTRQCPSATARWSSSRCRGVVDGSRRAASPPRARLAPGDRTAVVGPNGSGKSTLLAVLARHLDPSRGRYSLDDVDVRELSVADVRRDVAVVDDEPHVFRRASRATSGSPARRRGRRRRRRARSGRPGPGVAPPGAGHPARDRRARTLRRGAGPPRDRPRRPRRPPRRAPGRTHRTPRPRHRDRGPRRRTVGHRGPQRRPGQSPTRGSGAVHDRSRPRREASLRVNP